MLPENILIHILSYVSYFDLDNILFSNKRIKKIIYNRRLTIRYLKEKTEYKIEGKLHREDGQAIEYSDIAYGKTLLGPVGPDQRLYVCDSKNTKHWYYKGELHNDNGPAILLPDGSCEYRQHGLLHREDGPAIILIPLNIKDWYINHKRIEATYTNPF